MEIIPKIFMAKVMHKRLFPKVNKFTYGVYYLMLPLKQLVGTQNPLKLPYNKPGVLSFYDKDHGGKDGKNLHDWIKDILKQHNLDKKVNEIFLVSMPRVLGYVFNPVSFWFCLDSNKKLIAVLCQVNNTFGETHNYLCSNEDGAVIKSDDWICAKKIFHVSPFLKREGYYKFRFSLDKNKLGIWIDFYNKDSKKQLTTSLIGDLKPLTKENLRKAFWQHPLVTLKTIFLIHWQALKIISKGIKYISKPRQKEQNVSTSEKIKNI